MNLEEIIKVIVKFLKGRRYDEYPSASRNELIKCVQSIQSVVDERSVLEAIEEMDARGWILQYKGSNIIFDPAII